MCYTITNFLIFSFFVTFFITYQTPPVHGACGPAKSQNLSHYQNNFFFVRRPVSGGGVTRRGVNSGGGRRCPWVWKRTDDAARKPRVLTIAECNKTACPPITCRPVFYTHHVLMEECDKTTGIKVWVMKTRRLPIAYVYDV